MFPSLQMIRMIARKTRQGGMTLIEVMVALAVFAIASLSVVNVTTEHIRTLTYIEQKNIAQWIANNHLTQLQLEKKFPGLGSKQGKLEYGVGTWYWQQQVKKTEDPKFRSVTIRILTKEGSDNSLAELTTFVVRK